jgi:hypothetical protein
MKKLLVTGCAIFLLSTIYMSCKKNTDQNRNSVVENEISSRINSTGDERKFHIYFASWDEWGKASRDCKGWGLCNFQSCWFCCTDDHGQIINCQSEQKIANAGKITIDDATKQGNMIIELDPSIQIQNDAITQRLTLSVEQNIENAGFIIHASEYLFDQQIGSFGGYRLNVTAK